MGLYTMPEQLASGLGCGGGEGYTDWLSAGPTHDTASTITT